MPADDGANRELAPIREWADLPEWITTEEAAGLSGYSLPYVQRLARQGHIGAQKKSRTWWVDRALFASYLQAMMARDDRRAGPRQRQTPDSEHEAGEIG
jgi:excisionase family DNA binding protein